MYSSWYTGTDIIMYYVGTVRGINVIQMTSHILLLAILSGKKLLH